MGNRCRRLSICARWGWSCLMTWAFVVVPVESNVLLNPRHPDMARVRIGSNEAFRFDSRLC